MRTSWEKLAQHVGTKYGQEISNDLNNKITVNIVKPVHSTRVLVRYATQEALFCMGQYKIQTAFWSQARMLREVAISDPSDAKLPNGDSDSGQQDYQRRL